MNILVTGGAGFIASHLVDELVKRNHRVRVLDSFEPQVHGTGKPTYLNARAEYVEGKVQHAELLRKALKDIDVVFHEAAAVGVGQSMYQISHYVEANTQATAVLLDVIINDKLSIKKLIVASSMSIYGEGLYACKKCGEVNPQLRSEEQLKRQDWEMRCPQCQGAVTPKPTPERKLTAPTSIYASTKYDQEEMCLMIGRAYKVPTVALRYFNVYGTRQSLSNPYTGVCAIFSSRIKNNNAPFIYEDGKQSRDFVHVSDIVQANLLAMERPEADYEMFNVGTGQPITIGEIAQLLTKLYRKQLTPQLAGKFRSGDIRHCIADISKIQRIGFRPHVELAQGMQELVQWGEAEIAVDRVEQAARELEQRGLVT